MQPVLYNQSIKQASSVFCYINISILCVCVCVCGLCVRNSMWAGDLDKDMPVIAVHYDNSVS